MPSQQIMVCFSLSTRAAKIGVTMIIPMVTVKTLASLVAGRKQANNADYIVENNSLKRINSVFTE